jgi:hypothetical protein
MSQPNHASRVAEPLGLIFWGFRGMVIGGSGRSQAVTDALSDRLFCGWLGHAILAPSYSDERVERGFLFLRPYNVTFPSATFAT